MVGFGSNLVYWSAVDKFGMDISIDWDRDMSDSDREYIRGLNIKPINYSFTGKKAVIRDRNGNTVDQWFKVRGSIDCGFSTYVQFE